MKPKMAVKICIDIGMTAGLSEETCICCPLTGDSR